MSLLINQPKEFTTFDLINKRPDLESLTCSFEAIKHNKFFQYKSKNYSNNIKFSLATLLYDSKQDRFIHELIESFLNQTLDNIEIIILCNGASKRIINLIDDLLKSKDNVSLILNSFSQYNPASYEDPVPAFWNVSLAIAQGEIFSHISWDDKINNLYCEDIYRTFKRTGCKSIAAKVETIDEWSNLINKKTNKLNKSIENLPIKYDSKEIMMSRMGLINEYLLPAPGELLAFERNHFISRKGYDSSFDLNQYFKVASGSDIAIAKNSEIFWRYHANQGHHIDIFSGSLPFKTCTKVFENNNLFELHKQLYGIEWAKQVKNFIYWTLVIRLGESTFIQNLRLSPLRALKLIPSIYLEAGLIKGSLILLSVIHYLQKRSTSYIISIFKDPQKSIILFKLIKNGKFKEIKKYY